MSNKHKISGTVLGLLMLALGPAFGLPIGFTDTKIVSGLNMPTDMVLLGRGNLLVAEKSGLVWWVENGQLREVPVIDMRDEVGAAGERGLLGITVHPQFAENGYLYLLYSVDPVRGEPDESYKQAGFGRLTRYRVKAGQALPESRKILLGNNSGDGWPHCDESHAIGAVRFGNDGSLLVSAGEGAHWEFADHGQLEDQLDEGCRELFGDVQNIGAYRSQSLSSLGGKILRLDPATGQGFADNPFFDGRLDSVASRIWALGLRNPFRFTVGHTNRVADKPGPLFIADSGWDDWEEVNYSFSGGENFGWPCFEGAYRQPRYARDRIIGSRCENLMKPQPPWVAWHQREPEPLGFTGQSATGVVQYNGNSFPEAYRDQLFFVDFVRGWLKVGLMNGLNNLIGVRHFADELQGPVDLKVDPDDGSLLYISIIRGEIRRIRYRKSGDEN